MTRRSIEEQVQVLKKATEKASASPEAASAFLRSAGISVGRTRMVKGQYPTYSLATDGNRATESAYTGKVTGSKHKK